MSKKNKIVYESSIRPIGLFCNFAPKLLEYWTYNKEKL